MKKGKGEKRKKKHDQIILVKDLAPRKDVQGGAGKLLFGERAETPEAGNQVSQSPRKRKND